MYPEPGADFQNVLRNLPAVCTLTVSRIRLGIRVFRFLEYPSISLRNCMRVLVIEDDIRLARQITARTAALRT